MDSSTPPRFPSLIVGLAALALAAFVAPAAAAPSGGCAKLDLGVTRHVVADGSWLGVHGSACADGEEGGTVRIELSSGKRSRWVGTSVPDANGRFSTRVHVRSSKYGIVNLRAAGFGRLSPNVRVQVVPPVDSGSQPVPGPPAQSSSPSPETGATTQPTVPFQPAPVSEPTLPAPSEPTPPAPSEPTPPSEAGEAFRPAPMPSRVINPDPNSSCPLNDPSSTIGETVSGCRVVGSDTAADPNPLDFWGTADCGTWPNNLDPGRPERPTTGGDPDPTATGAPQGNSAYRVLTTYDGDDIDGERCELGHNDMDVGPTTYFYEGMRRATFFSERLPENFPLDTPYWQTVFQMKQDQPSKDDGGGPMIEMQATRNQWVIARDWNIVWSAPAQKNVWTRFVFDVVYSQNPEKGSIQIGVDLNGDGDFDDPGERSPKIHGATLSTQTEPGYEIPPGGSIPSHLRSGIYHDSRISCPRPVGCSAEMDNLQVVAP